MAMMPRFTGPALATAFAVGLACAGPAHADDPFYLNRPDLHAHFWVSYGLSLTATEVLEGPQPDWGPQWGTGKATLVASVGVGLIGIAKELTDERIDGGDLLADALGILANVLVQSLVEF
ncbi:MAG: hypothetical protein ACE366_04645 [Bradymonadia bacterium]